MKRCDVRLWLVIAIALACLLSSSPARAGETPNSSARSDLCNAKCSCESGVGRQFAGDR
jgi:hypothetical protein